MTKEQEDQKTNTAPSQSGFERFVIFFRLLPYVNKKYYAGRIKWLLTDKDGAGVYCKDCGNIANGVIRRRKLGLTFNIPYCKKHISEIYFAENPQATEFYTGTVIKI